ncbi:hypothetical protein C483_12433 [Natrialba hulunbeirensis JCM 10989]|uniref:DUF192 domain-containing protein n=1 Tax=Natrialba hulunbeirensis JCM 10989 TaxID=1227493 RepID=L9ZXI6_9EURY|nr:DUF192 domain-containing protein [Natrialba hulunbeirensis]ELY90317.1 hypothetical protein C483_12433 [Natrialba hulunbeirensis JCM 10989]
MVLERVWKSLLAVAALLLIGALTLQIGLIAAPWADDTRTLHVLDEDGDPKATIEVELADTAMERYTGLSDHDSLADGEGMLFIHASEGERTYVMRDMDFDIDIIFIDADREITSIEHARAPEPGEDGEALEYTGQGEWVLEVPRGYANQTGMEPGDEVALGEE